MPVRIANKKTSSLGMSLMAGLSEDLDGSFSIENNQGTTIKISFVHDSSSKLPGLPAAAFAGSN
jgi:two-component sensor histidine kinase